MPTPLPAAGDANQNEPERSEVEHLVRGLMSGMRPADGLTELQGDVLVALTMSMTGHRLDVEVAEPISAEDFARGLADRDLLFRTEMVQVMELGHMLLDAADPHVAAQIGEFADELCVDLESVQIARELASGSRELVAADIDRSGYISRLDVSELDGLSSSDATIAAWSETAIDETFADRWRALGELPSGTLGRSVHDFYVARGFFFPGEAGSAPPLLAQHDWVHVLADYGSQLESEIEVFAFMARASDDPAAFSLLAMALTLFQSGTLAGAAGIFEADAGHLSENGMPERLADAFRRGAFCSTRTDYLGLDYFALADRPIDDVRDHLGIPPKAASAIAAGSAGPFEAGGISVSQLAEGRRRAEEDGRDYDSFGASLG